ncbi:hypothetical protein QUB70_05230 [Microcoleus sp. A003_D6]|uniref:hypothetical protein n=1 Tax=Microcoleus sp. A003_D6 TaxID=3055266 RepID=UPI002FD36000
MFDRPDGDSDRGIPINSIQQFSIAFAVSRVIISLCSSDPTLTANPASKVKQVRFTRRKRTLRCSCESAVVAVSPTQTQPCQEQAERSPCIYNNVETTMWKQSRRQTSHCRSIAYSGTF